MRGDISMILSRCLYVWSVTDVHVQVTKALRLVVYSSSFCLADGNVCYIVLQHHVQHMATSSMRMWVQAMHDIGGCLLESTATGMGLPAFHPRDFLDEARRGCSAITR